MADVIFTAIAPWLDVGNTALRTRDRHTTARPLRMNDSRAVRERPPSDDVWPVSGIIGGMAVTEELAEPHTE